MTKTGSSTNKTSVADNTCAKAGCAKPRVRDRILQAASDLFYQQGINCVGIDAIVCEAGTNKMSLYRNFSSKDELVVQYLTEQEEEHFASWDAVTGQYPDDPRAQIEALFAYILEKGCDKGDCGCPSANAAIELRGTGHPALQVIYDGREKARHYLLERAAAAGARSPEVLADGLVLLLEGTVMSRLSFPADAWPADNLMPVVKALLDAELGSAD